MPPAKKLASLHAILSRPVGAATNEQILKLIIQYLQELGTPAFDRIARSISSAADVQLHQPEMDELTQLLTTSGPELAEDRAISRVESLLTQLNNKSSNEPATNSTELALIYKHLFLEALLLDNDPRRAVALVRRVQPIDASLSSKLSSLLIVDPTKQISEPNVESLRELNWPSSCDLSQSRKILLSEIMGLPSAVNTPVPHRLSSLIDEALKYQEIADPYSFPDIHPLGPGTDAVYRDFSSFNVATPKERLEGMPLHRKQTLSEHTNQVWYISYSHNSRYLATASVDESIVIYDADDNYSVYRTLKGHKSSIIYLSWSPDDTKLISSSFDQTIKIWTVQNESCKTFAAKTLFDSNIRIWQVEFMSNSTFLVGSPDKELSIFDLDGFPIHEFNPDYRIDDFTVIDGKLILAITHSYEMLIYRYEPKNADKEAGWMPLNSVSINRRVTSITHTPGDSEHVLINVKPDELQLWNISNPRDPYIENKYYGFQQSDYVVRSCTSSDGSLVLCGSKNGYIYVWNRRFGNLLTAIPSSRSLINCVTFRPNTKGGRNKCEWASCGDDKYVNIWGYKS